MEDLTTRAKLVDGSEVDAQGVTATVPRSEIEDALAADDGPADLILDVARFGDGGDGESRRVAVEWERDDLERLLRQTDGDRILFTFDRRSLAMAFDEPDVEPHGLREKALILTVAAATAAGAAGVAKAVPDAEGAGGGSSGAAAYTAIESTRLAENAGDAGQAAAASSGIEAARAAETTVADAGQAAAAGSSIEAARAAETTVADAGQAAAAGSSIEAARAAEAAPEPLLGYAGIETVGAEVAAELGSGQAAAEYTGVEAARASEPGTTAPGEYGMPQATGDDYLQAREYGLPQPTAADYVQPADYGMPTAMPSDYEVASDPGGGVSFEAPSPAQTAGLAGAAALAITGVAFAARSRRRLTPSN
jgi:hypothetical protein